MTTAWTHPRWLHFRRSAPAGETAHRSPVHRLWDRQLDHYPDTGPRYFYLAIVVLASITLYYEFYVQAAVTPAIIAHYHMTWPFFVNIVVVGNLVGAFASLAAGFADRWGRANLVVYGLLVTGLVVLVGMPSAPAMWAYGILYAVLGFVEGVILVATPALMRDFSPQLGRASAMGFWTIGPVVASLAVALVSSHTLSHLHAWQDQFTICGIVGLSLFVIALVGLRELSPGLRDQLMVSIRDRQLIEARAEGIDIEESIRHPWRKVFHLDIVGSSVGIAVYLVVYYTLIAFLVVYMATVFGYSQQRANALGDWIWAFDAGALVVVGILSDRLKVRKPFMVIGILGSVAATALFAVHATQPNTGYYTFVWILSLLAVFLGFTFAPWLAAFTETVEARSPALTATGLAIWGWVLRLAVAGSLFILPYVVTSMTPLVEHGTQVEKLAATYSPEVATAGAIDPATLHTLTINPTNVTAGLKAVGEVSARFHVTSSEAIQRLDALAAASKQAGFRYLEAHGPQIQASKSVAPHEWQRWWWAALGLQVLLLPLIFLMRGRWSPRRARRDEEEHERKVQEELAAMGG